jgi:hypothetical protein
VNQQEERRRSNKPAAGKTVTKKGSAEVYYPETRLEVAFRNGFVFSNRTRDFKSRSKLAPHVF